MTKAAQICIWIGRIVVAILFLVTGVNKLLGNQMMVDMFGTIGLGQAFRYFTGAVEVVGALLLLWPQRSFYGALLLFCVGIGAFFTQLLLLHGDVIHTIVICVATAVLAWVQRPRPVTAALT